jgi:glycosyltransferase involved in cell wall biosynthesis
MADASWDWYPDCKKATELVSRSGGSNIVVLHDILPLIYPRIFEELPASNFANWMEKVVPNVDAVVAVSKTVAEEFLDYIDRNKSARPDLQVGWNHLGADFEVESGESVSKRVAEICDDAIPFFLTVSTLETRKGFRIAIDAMDQLWADGANVRYVIPGRYGWGAEALVERIRSHPEYNRRLFWLEGVTAVDLRELYKSARSLIFASVAEGFGLPIVEAAYLGLPSIASDIPVFRERESGRATSRGSRAPEVGMHNCEGDHVHRGSAREEHAHLWVAS